MKTIAKFGTCLSLVVAAGCAHRAQYSNYDQTYQAYSSPYTRAYENPNFRNNIYNSSRTYEPIYGSSSINQTPSAQQTTSVATGGNDQVLVTQIRQSLNTNPNLAEVIPNIQVTAQNGTVILSGTVPNEQQKQAVETMVKSTTGVMNVNNQLQVNLSPTASKSLDKSSPTESGVAAASTDVSVSAPVEAKGGAADSATTSSGSSAAGLSSTNSSNPSTPSKGLPPTSDRQDEPRLYSTNNTGLSTGPQSSVGGDRSAAVSAGVAVSQSGGDQKTGTNQAGTLSTQSGVSQSGITNNPSTIAQSGASVEHKGLTASVDSSQKSAIYSNGASAALTNNSNSSTLYSSAGGTADATLSGTNGASQSNGESTNLTATGNSRSRRYLGANTNTNTTVSTAAATSPETFETNVQGVSQADQAIGQKIIGELRADTSLAALLPGIRVKIENGKATLSGTVKSQDEKLKIETAVQKVTGITSVDNQLRIGTTPASAPIR